MYVYRCSFKCIERISGQNFNFRCAPGKRDPDPPLSPTVLHNHANPTARSILRSYTSTQTLTTQNRAQTTRNAHPKAQKKQLLNLLNETSNSRTSRAYGISQLVAPSFQTSINGKSKSQGVQRHQERQKQRLDAMEIGGGKSRSSDQKETIQNDTVPTYQNDAVAIHQLTTALAPKQSICWSREITQNVDASTNPNDVTSQHYSICAPAGQQQPSQRKLLPAERNTSRLRHHIYQQLLRLIPQTIC
ncbi:Esterase/lipase/thioesterase family protein isoform 1 [Dorcoceras hygrometricum]|uniref:Esterase/lipase/thioesterase family protein isoform 1 n=1 Tax=Dorcoceras hygrometricum TaxID=472368 RepID=A0A2Z7D546_9LAMI|nr:Esterase/lipase/thioesterase family protein isoform 1 [Dorcoceras hygrometricum]